MNARQYRIMNRAAALCEEKGEASYQEVGLSDSPDPVRDVAELEALGHIKTCRNGRKGYIRMARPPYQVIWATIHGRLVYVGP